MADRDGLADAFAAIKKARANALAFAEAGAELKQAKADIPTNRLNANVPVVELH